MDPSLLTHDARFAFVSTLPLQDPHAVLEEEGNAGIKAMHENAKRHDPKTEEMFKYVQVFTAIVDSFSHGANDVANAMGPFSAICKWR
jgi:sodium-dependent phosphate transporter